MEPNNQWNTLTSSKPSAEHLVPGLYALARCWHDRGDLAPAEKIYRLILSIDDRVKNIKCGEVVLSALDLATLLKDTDRCMEAEHMYLRAINRCTHCLGQDHGIYALILRSYGELLRKMNLIKEAEALESRAKQVNEKRQYKGEPAYGESSVSSATIV